MKKRKRPAVEMIQQIPGNQHLLPPPKLPKSKNKKSRGSAQPPGEAESGEEPSTPGHVSGKTDAA